MNIGKIGSQTWVKAKRERCFGSFFWGSDAARLRPEASIFRRMFFQTDAALFHKGKKACFLIRGNLVLRDMAGVSSAIIKTISFYHPSRANFHL